MRREVQFNNSAYGSARRRARVAGSWCRTSSRTGRGARPSTGLAVTLAYLVAMPSALASIGESEITAAYHAEDTTGLELLRLNLDPNDDRDAYLAGYLDWRLGGLLVGQQHTKEADRVLRRGQETLQALNRRQHSAESLAMLSGIVGMRIGIRPVTRGMTLGRKASKTIDRALKLEPDNPRVRLIAGIAKLNAPKMFGGSVEAAIAHFDHALAAIADSGTGRYDWGEADVYIWRGNARRRGGDEAAARQDYARAVAVAPDYEWPKTLLGELDGD